MEENAIIHSAGVIKEVQNKVKNKELNSLKLTELKKISKQIGIKGISKLNKDSLINLIKKTISKKGTDKKTPAKKTPAKKTSTKKTPDKKTPAKKTSTKKTPDKKTPDKKTPAKKTPAKKTPAKKISVKKNIDTSNNKNQDKNELPEDYFLKFKKLGIDKINTKLEEVIESPNWIHKNREIQDLIKVFKEKFDKELKKAEKKFFENNSKDQNFLYKPKYKTQFDKIVYEYRDKRKKYYKNLDTVQNKNFEIKLEIIENIKKLIDENTSNFEKKYKEFKKNRENWHITGPVPRNKDQNLWQTYKHHVERFYDLLHLNRKLRDIDFKHNYEEKLKIIESAELLAKENNIIKAIRNINILHKKWKNELGPVVTKHRQSLWKRFQIATKKIQTKRKEIQKNATISIKNNLIVRKEILKKMKSYLDKVPSNHLEWQKTLTEFHKLKEEFKNVGYIPNKDGKSLWENFRDYSKSYMSSKNEFYKKQKVDYKNKILKKKELIKELKSHLESNDWDQKTETIKKNQVKWKSIGFIPRKIDNKLWKEFSTLNSIYFEKIKSGYNKLNENENESYKLKKEFLNTLNTLKIPKESIKGLKVIEKMIINWNKIDHLNKKTNKTLNTNFSKVLINKIENNKFTIEIKENLIFETRLKLIEFKIENTDYIYEKELKKERALINELNQLENNLDFFTNSSAENPLFKDVEKKILDIKNKILRIKENKKRIKTLNEGNEE